MLVTIVAVPLPDNSGLDVARLEKVEDLHPEIAQKMLDVGTARIPSSDELTAYHDAQHKAEPALKLDAAVGREPVDAPTASTSE